VTEQVDSKIDWAVFEQARADMRGGLLRVLGYFREDGAKSIAIIEEAVRSGKPVPIVLPANKIKAEALDLGALELAALAEEIEMSARLSVEWHQDTSELVEHVVQLRPLFDASLAELEAEANPLMKRRPSQRKVGHGG
jgi:histidine phosphotransfer protein HptB